MAKEKIKLWILHAGIGHPSPYFYNFCLNLDNNNDYEYTINPNLPLNEVVEKGIVYFNRLKRFYDSNDINSINYFLENIDILKKNGWKIVWTVHNFFPIDRKLIYLDEYVTNEFIKKCDLVFTMSKYMKKSIKRYYNTNAIVHGMGINTLKSNPNKQLIKDIPKNIFTFTFIGNIYKYKMLNEVIASFNKLDGCHLIIAGIEPANAGVNIEKLISNNKNITFLNYFIYNEDWYQLAKVTNVFISIYNLKEAAFKYGFFPSNFINISKTGIKCISPKHKIFKEMINNNQMIYYDFNDNDALTGAMKKAILNISKSSKKRKKIKLKYNYEWAQVVKCFTDNCKKLFTHN